MENGKRNGDKRKTLRKVWLQTHLWIGLTAGLFIALVGLSGALLIFIEDISRWENGDILFPEDAPEEFEMTPEKVDLWINNALETYKDTIHEVEVVVYPDAGHIPGTVPTLVSHLRTDDGSERHFVIGVNPETDEFTGATKLEEGIWVLIIFFHFTMLIPFGFDIVSWSSLLIFLSLITGLILWWPKATLRMWAKALSFPKKWKGRSGQLQWHNFAGVYLLIPMAIAIFTGLYLVKAQWFDPVIETVSEEAREVPFQPGGDHDHDHEHEEEEVETITPGKAIALAQEKYPGLVLRQIFIPHDVHQPFAISLMPKEWDVRKGHTQLWVDKETGEFVNGWSGDDARPSEILKSSSVAWHEDLGLGWFGEVLVFLSGIALPLLYITGIVLWRKRVKAKKRGEAVEKPAGQENGGVLTQREPVGAVSE